MDKEVRERGQATEERIPGIPSDLQFPPGRGSARSSPICRTAASGAMILGKNMASLNTASLNMASLNMASLERETDGSARIPLNQRRVVSHERSFRAEDRIRVFQIQFNFRIWHLQ